MVWNLCYLLNVGQEDLLKYIQYLIFRFLDFRLFTFENEVFVFFSSPKIQEGEVCVRVHVRVVYVCVCPFSTEQKPLTYIFQCGPADPSFHRAGPRPRRSQGRPRPSSPAEVMTVIEWGREGGRKVQLKWTQSHQHRSPNRVRNLPHFCSASKKNKWKY